MINWYKYLLAGLGILLLTLIISGLNLKSSLKQSSSPQPSKLGYEVLYSCQKSKNAFELLEQTNQVESEDSSLGKFVTSINGVKQGDNKYWLYSVDGKEATISASSYICQNQENIKWELK